MFFCFHFQDGIFSGMLILDQRNGINLTCDVKFNDQLSARQIIEMKEKNDKNEVLGLTIENEREIVLQNQQNTITLG